MTPSTMPFPFEGALALFLECVRDSRSHNASSIGRVFSAICPELSKSQRLRVYRAAICQGLIASNSKRCVTEWHLCAVGHEVRHVIASPAIGTSDDAIPAPTTLSIAEALDALEKAEHRFPHPNRYYLVISTTKQAALSLKQELVRARKDIAAGGSGDETTLTIMGSFLRAAQAVAHFEAIAQSYDQHHRHPHQTVPLQFLSVDIVPLDYALECTIRQHAVRHPHAAPISRGRKPRRGSDAFVAPLGLYAVPFHVPVDDDPAIQAAEAGRRCRVFLREAFDSALQPHCDAIFSTRHRAISRAQLQALVWAEEVAAQASLRLYDMHGCKFTQGSYNAYRLKVPGLAEKRPSVLVGDCVRIVDETTNQLHHGYVHFVHHDDIDVDVDRTYLKLQTAIYTVQFTMKRTDFRLLHRAIDETRVFLSASLAVPTRTSPWGHTGGGGGETHTVASLLNPLQAQFVHHTLDGTHRLGLLWGPPGTGKTTTLVRYMESLLLGRTPLKLLVCTPSNASADLVLLKLIECGAVQPGQTIRVVSYSRSVQELDRRLLPFVCTEWEDGGGAASLDDRTAPKCVFRTPTASEIHSATILIMTLGCCGRFFGCFPDFRCTHLVVDEAGQTTEAELCLALAFCDDVETQKIVLGGDPKQLGPVTQSLEARPYGASESPMQRLLECGDPNVAACTTMLEENYRSHEAIIGLVNRFYDGKLRPPRLGGSKCDAVGWTKPRIVWHHGASREQYEANSPSIFNIEEVERVVQYVDAIVTNCGVSLRDIAILAPYIKQVQKVRQVLRLGLGHLYDAEGDTDLMKRNVCSIEAFQGREARVVIITTVRTTEDVELLKADCRRHLGFVGQAQRTNVAVSRAIDAMVILGNLKLLARDARTWGPLLHTSIADPTHVIEGIDRAALTDILNRGADALSLGDGGVEGSGANADQSLHADTVFARRLDD